MVGEPVGCAEGLSPTVTVARIASAVRDRPLHDDHLATEVTLCAVAHLSGFNVKAFRLDVELVERPRRQPNEFGLRLQLEIPARAERRSTESGRDPPAQIRAPRRDRPRIKKEMRRGG